jgi:hypothetical protein
MFVVLLSLSEAVEWELVKQKDGITVYTRSVEGSGFFAFKGETVVEGSVDALVAVLYDTPGAPAWLHQCRFGMTLEEVSFEENYIFQIYDLPFPASNREVVLHTHLSLAEGSAVLETTEANGFCDSQPVERCRYVEEVDLTRIEKSRGRYLFVTEENNRTRVVWQQYIEPGGYLPDWLVNALLVDIPFNSLSRLRELVKTEKYRSMTIQQLRALWREKYRRYHKGGDANAVENDL